MKYHLHILSVLFVVSCTAEEQKSNKAIIAVAASPVTIDIQKSTDTTSRGVFLHIYDSILSFDTNGEVNPSLATSWEFVNPTNLQLTIRKDVKFHNGKLMTVDDVVASLNRLRVVPESQTLYSKIANVTSSGEDTVNIHLSVPFPSIIGYLAHPKASVYPKELIDTIGTNTVEEPIGTGPYQYEEFIHGDRVTLKANKEYWNGAPSIDTLEFKVIIDESVRAISLETGDIQGVLDLPASQVAQLEENPDIVMIPFNSIGVDYLGLNTISPRLQNKRLREAITMAIDKNAIIDTVFFGLAKPADSLFDDRMLGAYTDPENLSYNPEAARKIIEEEGLTGYKISILTTESYRSKIAEVIQFFLKEIGLELEIHVLEWAAYLDTLKQGNHDLFLLGWSNSAFDPDSSIYTLFHTANIEAGYNKFMYSDPNIDRLIEEASIELDSKKREQMYIDIQKKVREDRYVVFLFARIYNLAFDNKLAGYELIPTGDHKLHHIYYKK